MRQTTLNGFTDKALCLAALLATLSVGTACTMDLDTANEASGLLSERGDERHYALAWPERFAYRPGDAITIDYDHVAAPDFDIVLYKGAVPVADVTEQYTPTVNSGSRSLGWRLPDDLVPGTDYVFRTLGADGMFRDEDILTYFTVTGPTIAAGYGHTVALKDDGTVWASGSNSSGQLGNNSTSNRTVAVQVVGLSNATAAAAGYWHSAALKGDGTVWTWGKNSYGQLGDNSTTNRKTPVQVVGLSNAIAVSGGHYHTVALKSDGTVWAWGQNNNGQLGDGTTTDRHTPVRVTGLSDVTAIATFYDHTMALKSDGTAWGWGYNVNGQLGEGVSSIYRTSPVQVSGLSGITSIATGYGHTVARRSDGTVWAWGYNGKGQLGDGTTSSRMTPTQVPGFTNATAVGAGWTHTVALKSDGTAWAWGSNDYGQIGDYTTSQRTSPRQVFNFSNGSEIAAGTYHSLAHKSDGTVWAWGRNQYGQLGDGTTIERHYRVKFFLGL